MEACKIIYFGKTLIDLTSDSVTPDDLLLGVTAHSSTGTKVTGTIATKTSSNLSANGATVTVPAGYYASQASKSVATTTRAKINLDTFVDGAGDYQVVATSSQKTGYVTGGDEEASATIPAGSVSKPTINVSADGLITANVEYSEGYITSDTTSDTEQLATQGATTITPTTYEQTAVAENVYTTGAITVAAIPSHYADISNVNTLPGEVLEGCTFVDSSGDEVEGTISIRDDSDLYQYDELTVAVPSGYYDSEYFKSLSDSNLRPGNIKSGVTIFGVEGTYEPETSSGISIGTFYLNSSFNESSYNFVVGMTWDDLAMVNPVFSTNGSVVYCGDWQMQDVSAYDTIEEAEYYDESY